uniref:GST C-terminal domain-containing protein n=1 Tax=Coccolithus braarudii TaxID=221442 RepID=A0A7S0Q412_9EUKA
MTAALLCKPSYLDPSKVGDCPFTHFARVALHLGGCEYIPWPTAPDAKPNWLLDEHGGSMPCLAPMGFENGDGAVSDSFKIASTALPPTPADTASLAAADGFFPSIAKFIKNTDAVGEGQDVELRQALVDVLVRLDTHLQSSGATFFGGEAVGLADASIATKLFMLECVGNHYKSFTLDSGRMPALSAYQKRMLAVPEFESTKPELADAVTGWGQARGGGH